MPEKLIVASFIAHFHNLEKDVTVLKDKFMPLFANASLLWGHKAIFYTTDKQVVVEAPRDLLHQLVITCDGAHTLEEVIEKLSHNWDGEEVMALIESLRQQKVILDAQWLADDLWKVVKNPSYYPRNAVNNETAIRLAAEARERQKSNPSLVEYQAQSGLLGSLLAKRQSTRTFTGKPLSSQKVFNILWSAYGVCKSSEVGGFHRTVASAGALYSLNIHVALFAPTGDLEPGIYQVYLGNPDSVGSHLVSQDTTLLSRSFLVHPLILQKAHGVIVISGSFNITSEKYGNRSMLYVPLEAGYTAQNIHLSAIENDVATVEVGGFADDQLAEAIQLNDGLHPLTTIVFGERDNDSCDEDIYPDLEVQWAIPTNKKYRPPFAIASARVSEKRSWSHGRDVSPTLAYAKAISEAKEWAACGCLPDTLIEARFADLETAIDPREVIKFHPSQYRLKGFPFKPFDESSVYAWTEGNDLGTGQKAHILADLVYFPYFPKTPYYAYSNSSGVAAHPDLQQAIQISTLELVERDAFMIAYLAGLEMPTVRGESLPDSIRKRISDLHKTGFEITIKDHSLDLAPVVCVLTQSEDYGCTACASCSSFDVEDAVSHALMEVEAFVLARLENGKTRSIKPVMVGMPLEHGQLYDQVKYFHRADFLLYGRTKVDFDNIGKDSTSTWQDLLERFHSKKLRLITIPLCLSGELGKNGNLHIIRSIVPGLVPMTFGNRQEPGGMNRIYEVAGQYNKGVINYGDLTKFPHPYA